MREVLCLHVGQAGTQLGNSFWEILAVEHSVSEEGLIAERPKCTNDKIDTFYSSSLTKYIPRCIFMDLEPSVIDEIKMGPYRLLFHPDRLISGPEDAASNFARGFFTVGKLLIANISLEVQKMFETADCVEGIMIFRSLGGGTGSGLTSAIFDGLSDYPKTTKIDVPIFPSPILCSSIVEPYNAVLATHFCLDDIDIGLLFDNEALYDICTRFLYIDCPTFSSINRLIAQLCSCITTNVRYENMLNCDLTVLQTNLVPYPRIHFPICNFCPIIPEARVTHESMTVSEITHGVFDRENQMVKIDPTFGRYMSCVLCYRGAISPDMVYRALLDIKRDKHIDFVEWCPTGFKVGINTTPPIVVPNSFMAASPSNVAMLTNSSSIGQAWQRLARKFYLLYAKRSFLHWFVGEGMEECEFTEALLNTNTLVQDYEAVTVDSSKTDATER